jgi:hypothetical protein
MSEWQSSPRKDLARIIHDASEMLLVYTKIESICSMYGILNCETEYPKQDVE